MKKKWRVRIKELEGAVAELALQAEGRKYDFECEATDDVMKTLEVKPKAGSFTERREPVEWLESGQVMIPTTLEYKPIHPFVEPLARILHIECVGGHAEMTWEKVGNDWRRFAYWLLEDPDHVIHGCHPDKRNDAVLKKLRELGVCQYSKYVRTDDSDEIHAKVVERTTRWAYRMYCAKEMD